MLFLLLQLGTDRYALAAADVLEILPLVQFKQLPHTPPEIVGVFNFRGVIVPALDLSQLALGTPSTARLSTRIVLVNYRPGQPLGLIAERVTQTLRCEVSAFAPAGLSEPGARYLGPITQDAFGIVQRLEIAHLITDALRARLYVDNAAASA